MSSELELLDELGSAGAPGAAPFGGAAIDDEAGALVVTSGSVPSGAPTAAPFGNAANNGAGATESGLRETPGVTEECRDAGLFVFNDRTETVNCCGCD